MLLSLLLDNLTLIFFFNDTATTEIYTLSLHDALPICPLKLACKDIGRRIGSRKHDGILIGPPPHLARHGRCLRRRLVLRAVERSEEHTSELQSRQYLVCRLLLEKKKNHLLLHSITKTI